MCWYCLSRNSSYEEAKCYRRLAPVLSSAILARGEVLGSNDQEADNEYCYKSGYTRKTQ